MADDGLVDEETLLEYDIEAEPEAPAAPGLVRSTPPFPSVAPDGRGWAEWFTAARLARAQMEIPALRKLVLWVDLSASEEGLGASPRKMLTKLRAAGWPSVVAHSSIVAVSDEFYAADSKKKPGQEAPEHRKGDLKKPAHIERHWWVEGVYAKHKFAVRAHWLEKKTPTGGRGFAFQRAVAADPIGMPTELYADYSLDADAKKRRKDEPGEAYERRLALAEAAAQRQDREYNNQATYRNRRPMFVAWGEFEAWLDETLAIFAPRPTPEP